LDEILVPGGGSRYASIMKALDRCHEFPIASSSGTVNATMSALSFPVVGQRSAAYGISFSVDGVNGAEDVVVALKGSTVIGLSYGDVGSVDVTVLEGFVNKALAKVPPIVPASKQAQTTTSTSQPVTVPPSTASPPTAAPQAPSPTPAGCYVDPEGNCYHAGEYCPNSLHGQTVQGSAGQITCEDNNGWRWEAA
jgi:hypothetical protein